MFHSYEHAPAATQQEPSRPVVYALRKAPIETSRLLKGETMKAMVVALGFSILAGSVIAADSPCSKGERKGGLDFSLPCYWHSPIPAEDAVIGFAPKSAELSSEAQAILDRQADILARFPRDAIELVGYADTVEAATALEQAELGQKRAKVARDHLIGRGIAPDRITASGRDHPFMIPRHVTPETLARMRVVFTRVGEQ